MWWQRPSLSSSFRQLRRVGLTLQIPGSATSDEHELCWHRRFAAPQSAPFLAFVLRDPRLHQFLDECCRQWLVAGELDGAFGCREALKFVLELFNNRGSGK